MPSSLENNKRTTSPTPNATTYTSLQQETFKVKQHNPTGNEIKLVKDERHYKQNQLVPTINYKVLYD